MGPDWDENSSELQQNLEAAAEAARDHAAAREAPSLSVVRDWHKQIMEGLNFPLPADPSWVGRFRGEVGQTSVVVRVGSREGVPPDVIRDELERFEAKLIQAVERLDERVPAGHLPDETTLDLVLDLCAWTHAERVRIHPFANGNCRTARLWANWVAVRYGLPFFVQLRPRPEGSSYAAAGAHAMAGDWTPTAVVLRSMLERFLQEQEA